MSDNQMVLQSLDKGLLTITMNRPDRRNALNPEMTQGLVEAARRAQDDTEVRAVLIRGAGGTSIDPEAAWEAHRLQASYTVVATFLAFMPSYAAGDGVALGNDLLARANAALEDLDVVAAIEAALPG